MRGALVAYHPISLFATVHIMAQVFHRLSLKPKKPEQPISVSVSTRIIRDFAMAVTLKFKTDGLVFYFFSAIRM